MTYAVSSAGKGSGIDFVRDLFNEWADEVRYRKYNLNQYKVEISTKVTESIENFRKDQLKVETVAQKDLESYKEKINQLYESNLAALNKQKNAVDEIKKIIQLKRPPKIDDSLEQFKRFYNESIIVGPYERVSKQWKWNILENKTNKELKEYMVNWKERTDPELLEKNVELQIKFLQERFQSDWMSTFKVEKNMQGKEEKIGTAERATRNAAQELSKLHEYLTMNARLLALSTHKSIQTTIDKKDARRETKNLEDQLMRLSREGN